MTKDDIITLPNPRLRQKSQRIGIINDAIKQLVTNMEAATMNWDASREHEVGVALAAIQIDQLYKVVVVRNDYDNKENHTFTAYINPEVTKFEGKIEEDFEGCLSVPLIYGKVPRYSRVRVKALDIDGHEFRTTANGFLARVFQHEIDHTNGIVFIDHIRDNPKAFFELNTAGELEQLNYDDVTQNQTLWPET